MKNLIFTSTVGLETGGINLFKAGFDLIMAWAPWLAIAAIAVGGVCCCFGEKSRQTGKEIVKWAAIGLVGVLAAGSIVNWITTNSNF